MLVLQRNLRQRVLIGKNQEIVVEVLEIRGGKVRLGFIAPDDMPILREEIAPDLSTNKENTSASDSEASKQAQ